jgi:hypothetical protein
MIGPIEVREITQVFNRDTGFVSVITPGMCVDANEMFSMSVMDLAASATWYAYGINENSNIAQIAFSENPISMLAAAAGVKIVNCCQDGMPVVTTPLTLGGKPFMSVSMGQRYASLFLQLNGKWTQYWDDLGDAWRKFDFAEAIFDTRLSVSQKFYKLFVNDVEKAEP